VKKLLKRNEYIVWINNITMSNTNVSYIFELIILLLLLLLLLLLSI